MHLIRLKSITRTQELQEPHNMGSATSHVCHAPKFTDIQHSYNELIHESPERERSRRETMKAVLKYLGQDETNGVEYLMIAYTQWLLTAKKTTIYGHRMNRWELMTSFVEEQSFF